MPNIKSAEKRVKVIAKKTMQNNMVKSGMKTSIRKFEEAVAEENKELATKTYIAAQKQVDMAAQKGLLKKNTAARKKSTMNKKLNNVNK